MRFPPPLFKYEVLNVARGKWLLFYAGLFAAFLQAMLTFGGDSTKAVASMMSLVLLVIPMVSLLYASVYWYNSEGFTATLLTQPVRRSRLYFSRWCATAVCLSTSFVVGMLLPLALSSLVAGPTLLLIVIGVLLTFIFSAMGMLVAVIITDRMTGLGAAFLIWFYFAIVHDGVVFLFLSTLHDYPTEIPMMVLTAANPIDLGRLVLLMTLDFSAMMGYTGTILQQALSGLGGYVVVTAAFVFWIVTPVAISMRLFEKRDL